MDMNKLLAIQLEKISAEIAPKTFYDVLQSPKDFPKDLAGKISGISKILTEKEMQILSLRASKTLWKIISYDLQLNRTNCYYKWQRSLCRIKARLPWANSIKITQNFHKNIPIRIWKVSENLSQ